MSEQHKNKKYIYKQKAADLKGRRCCCDACDKMCIFVSFVCVPLGYVHINLHSQPKDVELGVTRFNLRVCVTFWLYLKSV